MDNKDDVPLREDELGSVLRAFASRLRLFRHAIYGMAHFEGNSDTAEHRARVELADELSLLADQLERIETALCSDCRRIEVYENMGIVTPGSDRP